MSDWDDFQKPVSKSTKKEESDEILDDGIVTDGGCNWGQVQNDAGSAEGDNSESNSIPPEFIPKYEGYLNDKRSLVQQTRNYKTYSKNSQKELREWFENEGLDFELETCESTPGEYICSLDLPVGDQDFTLTSERYSKKSLAIDEICLDACRLLDACQLLYANRSGTLSQAEELARKRLRDEANKEDDIVFDRTDESTKRGRFSETKASSSNSSVNKSKLASNKINTYETLMARWSSLNMNILKSKAKLVRLNLSVTSKVAPVEKQKHNDDEDDDDEVDPLDEFMSGLETKTKLTMDDKIEKSRLKAQIAEYEREQAEVARLLEVAKPSYNASKIQQGSK